VKTCGHVFERISAVDNLHAAWRQARRGKRYRRHAARFELDAELHLLRLSRELAEQSYRPGRFRLMLIREPKRRLIAAAPFRDRVVHHAICRVVMPQLSRSFIHDSYACIPSKGTHRAALRHLEFMRRFRYRCHIDVRAFFPTVPVDRLLEILGRRVRDRQTMALLGQVLESGLDIYRNPQLMAYLGLEPHNPSERRGLPIGNLTSQHLANVYLDPLDHHVKRVLGVRGYLRYMDDMVLFGDDRSHLAAAAAGAVGYLRSELRLNEKAPPALSRTSRPVDFLGHRIARCGLALSDRTLAKIRTRARRLASRAAPNKRIERIERIERSVHAWRGVLLLA
jgi:retron-type reverse transcriptase